MTTKPIRVRSTSPHMRGQRIAGQAGRLYWIDPKTGMLHAWDGKAASPEPGVHPDDAKRFRGFAGYEVEKRPPPPPKTPPAKPSASGESGSGDALPDSTTAPSGSPDASAPGEPEEPARTLPGDDDEWTIKQWLSNAEAMGIELSADEAATRPKSALCDLIRAKAHTAE